MSKVSAESMNMNLRQEAKSMGGLNKNIFIVIALVLLILFFLGAKLQDNLLEEKVSKDVQNEVVNGRESKSAGVKNKEVTSGYKFEQTSYAQILKEEAEKEASIAENAINNYVGDGDPDVINKPKNNGSGWDINLTNSDENNPRNVDDESIILGLKSSGNVSISFNSGGSISSPVKNDGISGILSNSNNIGIPKDVGQNLPEQLKGVLSQLGQKDPILSQNQQEEKVSFLSQDKSYINQHQVSNLLSPYTILQGTAIPVTLLRGINTDLPGEVTALVTRDIYDSVTGKYLLIPKMSKFHGVYQSVLSYGQERILSVWNRLIFPNGSSIELDKFTSADLNGFSGFKGEVDTHILSTLTGAFLSSVISVGAVAAKQGSDKNNVGDLLKGGVAQNAEEIGTEFMRRRMNQQNTLTSLIGKRFSVTVSKDLILRRYK